MNFPASAVGGAKMKLIYYSVQPLYFRNECGVVFLIQLFLYCQERIIAPSFIHNFAVIWISGTVEV